MYKWIKYYPEVEKSDVKILMDRIVEHSKRKSFDFARHEWDYDCNGKLHLDQDEDAQCICRKKISNLYFIDNRITNVSMALGSCCIKKFLPEAVSCKMCKNPLKDICKRLRMNDLVCPDCKKTAEKRLQAIKKKYDNYKFYWMGHKYNRKPFYQIIDDINFVTWLVNNKPPFDSKTYEYFMEYATAFYDGIDN